MRSKKRFSNKPKRTPEERRKALVAPQQAYLLEDEGVDGSPLHTNIAAMDDAKFGTKRASMRPWMKRRDYVKAYGRELRGRKWVARNWRAMERRYQRKAKLTA